MRIVGTADVHLAKPGWGTATPLGLSTRDADRVASLERFVDLAIDREADVAVLAGDLTDNRHPPMAAVRAIAAAVSRAVAAGVRVVACSGNHDGQAAIGDPRSNALGWLEAIALPGTLVATVPGAAEIETRSGPLYVAVVPYPHRRALSPGMTEEDVAEQSRAVEREVETAIEGLAPRGRSIPSLLVGHFTLAGALISEESAMRIGWDVTIRQDVVEGFDLALLGHVHKPQRVGPRAYYVGAPEHSDFAALDGRSFLVADVEAGAEPTVELVPSGARPAFEVEVDVEGDVVRSTTLDRLTREDAPIVRLVVRASRRPPARVVADLVRDARSRGAAYVAPTRYEIEAGPDARSEVVRAITPETEILEATRAVLAARGEPEEPALTFARRLMEEVP